MFNERGESVPLHVQSSDVFFHLDDFFRKRFSSFRFARRRVYGAAHACTLDRFDHSGDGRNRYPPKGWITYLERTRQTRPGRTVSTTRLNDNRVAAANGSRPFAITKLPSSPSPTTCRKIMAFYHGPRPGIPLRRVPSAKLTV